MIVGSKIQAIFMVVKINDFAVYADTYKRHITDFVNKVALILHQCADKWEGWANKSDGDKFLITWKLPNVDS